MELRDTIGLTDYMYTYTQDTDIHKTPWKVEETKKYAEMKRQQ